MNIDTEEFKWPTTDGIWMGFIEEMQCWFPLKTMHLRDDLPSAAEIAREHAGEKLPERESLAIIAQFPKSEESWPFLFQSIHPVTRWRVPTEEEETKAKAFYRL